MSWITKTYPTAWVVKVKSAKAPIIFDGDARIRIFVNDTDIRDHSKVMEIDRMEISGQEKLRILQEKEKEIINDIATEKYIAASKYAETSQGVKIDAELGAPQGTVDWNDILRLEEVVREETPTE